MWTYLPAGWRAHRKAEQIVREELDAIGGQEMLDAGAHARPSCGSAAGATRSTSCSSSRTAASADLVLAMSHEETLTFHMAREVRSYRDLPQLLYHFQIKERDEPRPRAGVLRTREFIMKDAYSLRPRRGGAGGVLRPPRRRPTTGSSTAAGSSGTGSSPTWG